VRVEQLLLAIAFAPCQGRGVDRLLPGLAHGGVGYQRRERLAFRDAVADDDRQLRDLPGPREAQAARLAGADVAQHVQRLGQRLHARQLAADGRDGRRCGGVGGRGRAMRFPGPGRAGGQHQQGDD
jgi:hypothetical protein